MKYQVIVGNIGTVYDGNNVFDARVEFNTHLGKSMRGEGRAANEPVTLMKDGEPVEEFSGVRRMVSKHSNYQQVSKRAERKEKP